MFSFVISPWIGAKRHFSFFYEKSLEHRFENSAPKKEVWKDFIHKIILHGEITQSD